MINIPENIRLNKNNIFPFPSLTDTLLNDTDWSTFLLTLWDKAEV